MKAFLLCLLLLAGPAVADTAANSAWLAANAAKPGTVTRPSGLQYRVIKSGFGRRPGGDDVIRVSYNIALTDGTVVDSTPAALPATLLLSSVSLRGLAEALALMHEGDRWRLGVPPALALGVKGGVGGKVPPESVLVMDVTLISAASPKPGEALPQNPFSTWSNGREMGGAITIRP